MNNNWNGFDDEQDYVLPSEIADLEEEIICQEHNEPKDKRTKDWKEWREHINELMEIYNQKVGFAAYKLIK